MNIVCRDVMLRLKPSRRSVGKSQCRPCPTVATARRGSSRGLNLRRRFLLSTERGAQQIPISFPESCRRSGPSQDANTSHLALMLNWMISPPRPPRTHSRSNTTSRRVAGGSPTASRVRRRSWRSNLVRTKFHTICQSHPTQPSRADGRE
jgi:hypothetical protein